MLRAIRYAALVVSIAAPLAAQVQHGAVTNQPTLALTTADYAKWETLGSNALSPDGKWIAYDLRRGNGSTELRYHTIGAETEHTVRSATGPQFTNNGHWLLYTIVPDTAGGAGRGGGRAGRGGGGGAA